MFSKTKTDTDKANVYVIYDYAVNEQINNDHSDEYNSLPFIKKFIDNHDYKSLLKRGDIIQCHEDPYRNEYKYIWDGSEILNLDMDIDDYGGVPPQFMYPEFPLNYWDNAIDHNYIRWVDLQIVEQLIENYDPILKQSCLGNNQKVIVEQEYNNEEFNNEETTLISILETTEFYLTKLYHNSDSDTFYCFSSII